MRRLPLAVAASALALTACSSGGSTTTPSAAGSGAAAPTSAARATSSSAPTPTPKPAKTITVAARGTSSAECKAASSALSAATRVGGLANQGKVTKEAADALSGPEVAALPADAKPYLEPLQRIAGQLVGKDASSAQAYLVDWSGALSDFVTVSQKVCS